MKILFFSSVFPHGSARVTGTFNGELCRALAVAHEVRVVSPRSFFDVWRSRRSEAENLAADCWMKETSGLRVSYPTFFYMPGFARHWHGEFQWLSVRRHLRAVLDEFRPEAIVSYWAHPDGEVGLRAAQSLGLPSVVIVGGSDVLILTRDSRRRSKIQRVLHESGAVMTVSEGLRQAVIELGTDPARVVMIYQGVDDDLFHPGDAAQARRSLSLPSDRRWLLWVGRMVDVKGLDTLIAAFDLARQRQPDLQLLLVGDGPLRESVLSDIRRRSLSDHVRWIGVQSPVQLRDWYRAADLVLLSSWSEGLPNVLREALSCGRPFVSTDVGSVRELADSRGGPPFAELVPIGNASAMADAIERTLHPDYLAAAQSFPRRGWRDTAGELVDLLQRLRGKGSRQQACVAGQVFNLPTTEGQVENLPHVTKVHHV